MSKKIVKRKSRGMALIFTLMVAVLAVAIASSYIGMTASSAKSARAYTKEAVALSVAQLGLDSVLNAMGTPDNWTVSGNISKFGRSDTVNLNINFVDGAISSVISRDESTSTGNRLILKTSKNASDLYTACFGDGFLVSNTLNATKVLQYANVYVTDQSFPVMYGDVKKYASLIVAVVPENTDTVKTVNATSLPKNNINYAIGVTSIITDSAYASGTFAGKSFADIVPNIISSRTVKMRTSSVYPGSVYQNVVAADFPNSGHYDQADFGYPNWEDYTANAAFIDEKTDMDGGIKVDGATNNTTGNTTNRWGAPQKTRNFSQSNFSSKTSADDSNLTDYKNGRNTADTAGILRFTTLDNNFLNSTTSTSSTSIESKLKNYNPANGKYLSEIAKKGTANQKAVYWDMVSGNTVVEKGHDWIDNICTSKTTKFESDYSQSNISSIWGEYGSSKSPLLSSGYSDINQKGTSYDGLYRSLKGGSSPQSSNPTKGYFNYTTNDYKTDPMYANETMEVPTLRITISQKNGKDEYKVEKLKYKANANKPSGWEEDTPESTWTLSSDNVDGMIYVAGANVQVKGTVSKPITIVSDVNPSVEKDNYDASTGREVGKFDGRLCAPNVKTTNGYNYVDIELDKSSSSYYTLSSANTLNSDGKTITSGANRLISQVNNTTGFKVSENGNVRFPTYGMEEQPSGNITIIGDLTTSGNTNPTIGIVAKNRVLLNDFSHDSSKSAASTMDDARRDAMNGELKRKNPENTSIKENNNNLSVNAVIASENHNMCFDFNNISKNLDYSTKANLQDTAQANKYYSDNSSHAPGDTSAPTGKTYTSSATNYGILVDEKVAGNLAKSNTINTGANSNDLVSDSGANNGGRYFYYKYKNMTTEAKKMIWYDTYIGAIRGENIPIGNIYTGGTLDFHGLIISRFGDINADAGVRVSDGTRINRLGYVNQLITFDSNYLDNCPPYFSMASQNYSSSKAALIWNIISYVDKGALTW